MHRRHAQQVIAETNARRQRQAAYNKALSDRRAASVKKYLVSKGIAPDRLTSKGYGMERPIVPNDSEQNRALNRRVQFVRTEGGGTP